MEKELERRNKEEGAVIKQELKNLSRLEKEVHQAQKLESKADLTLSRREKYENRTAKALNDAIHQHDIAAANLQASEKDAKLKHDRRVRLVKALEVKRTTVKKAIERQEENDKRREAEVARIGGVSVPVLPEFKSGGVGLPGQSGPAMDNYGHAAGYGIDYNHTTVDSEGNPSGTANYHGGSTRRRNRDEHSYT